MRRSRMFWLLGVAAVPLLIVSLTRHWLWATYQCSFGEPPRSQSSPAALLISLRATVKSDDRAALWSLYLTSCQNTLTKLDVAMRELSVAQRELVLEVEARIGNEEAELLQQSQFDIDSLLRTRDLADLKMDYQDSRFRILDVVVQQMADGNSAIISMPSGGTPELWLLKGANGWELVPALFKPGFDLESIPPALDRLTSVADCLANEYRSITASLRKGGDHPEVTYREMMFAALLRANSTR